MARARKSPRRDRRNKRRNHAGRRKHRRTHGRKSFIECQDYFLTASFWKVLHQAANGYTARRWKLKPLVMVAILMMFSTAPSVGERFELARRQWCRIKPGRKRVGKTVEGFRAAVGRVPRRALKQAASFLRPRIAQVLAARWYTAGWIAFGVDGTRLALPRYEDLERRFGNSGKGEIPQLWLTSLVHLQTGVPWSWRLGRSKSSERRLFLDQIDTLPENALVVADAGFTGYHVWRTLDQAGHRFLIRLSSTCHGYADFRVDFRFREGMAYFWPQDRRAGDKPLKLRLIRLPGKQGKSDVWLATNVLDSTHLSRATAGKLFRARWEQEVFYRGYKCTLKQAKLSSRSVGQAIREVEIALMATQLLLAQSQWAVQRSGSTLRASPAEAVRQVRRELLDLIRRGFRVGYLGRLARAVREARPGRSSPKVTRDWPRKSQHKPPGPPVIHPLTDTLKSEIHNALTT